MENEACMLFAVIMSRIILFIHMHIWNLRKGNKMSEVDVSGHDMKYRYEEAGKTE
jgi:hypothetical protein